MGGRAFGYVRVSTADQNEDRQFIALERAGVLRKNICMDKQSRQAFERNLYKKLSAN